MLGKLFKHEFASIGKMALLLLMIAFGVTILGEIYLLSPLFDSVSHSTADMPGLALIGRTLGLLGILSYALMLFGMTVGFIIYVSYRYYKSMFSDEGYLTHTLPVKSSDLLIAKIVTSSVCYFAITFALYFFAILLVLTGISRSYEMSLFEFLTQGKDKFLWIYSMLTNEFGLDITPYGVTLVISAILTPITNIAITFGSLTLGQYSWKNKGLMGIAMLIIVRLVMSVVNGVVSGAYTVVLTAKDEVSALDAAMMLTNGRYVISTGIEVVFAIVLFFLSIHVIKNRLNLE